MEKYWLQSKQMILHISNTLTGILGILATQFNGLLSDNFEWIKGSGIKAEYVFALMVINGLFGAYLRYTSKGETLTTKKE